MYNTVKVFKMVLKANFSLGFKNRMGKRLGENGAVVAAQMVGTVF